MALFKLSANQPPARFYTGGRQIAKFRSDLSYEDRTPEDWVGSTTCCHGQHPLGLSNLPDGSRLVDAIKEAPLTWLGSDHLRTFGLDTKILVKLLDAGQRLPIHAHPHAKWAKMNVGAAHGKAEAWFTLTSGEVYLGLKCDLSSPELLSLVEEQQSDILLQMMHRIPVEPYQSVYVPPGILHAIGEGLLLVEIQEPEDLSILLEWEGFDIDGKRDGHLGLGFERALTGVESTKWTNAEIQRLITPAGGVGDVIVPAANVYFRLEYVKVFDQVTCDRGFAVLIVLDGPLVVSTAYGGTIELRRGETAVVGYGEGPLSVRGQGSMVLGRPPSCPKQ